MSPPFRSTTLRFKRCLINCSKSPGLEIGKHDPQNFFLTLVLVAPRMLDGPQVRCFCIICGDFLEGF